MKTLFFSTKPYEQPYLETANKQDAAIVFLKKALSVENAHLATGFDIVSIFTGDDASAAVLEILHNLNVKYITTRAAGYDNIDIKKANECGISVTNVPAYSPHAIAEHAVALILALNRKIVTAYKQEQQQNFTTDNLIGFDLHGKTVGIIGIGIIGSVLVKILHGFGCKILGCDLKENDLLKTQYGVQYTDKETLCATADIISIHTSLTPETKYLINKKLIALMKQGVMLINTGRGGCVNTADVIEGLENGHIGFYGADVYENERNIFFCNLTGKEMKDEMLKKLLSMNKVLITPHEAFATVQALTNIAVGKLCFLAGKETLIAEEIIAHAKSFIEMGKCEVMVISMGETGAMLVTKDVDILIKPPSVERKSTVGAGDSMVAGIVQFLNKGKNILEAVKYGVACGTAATMNTGTQLCNVKDAEMLFKIINNSE